MLRRTLLAMLFLTPVFAQNTSPALPSQLRHLRLVPNVGDTNEKGKAALIAAFNRLSLAEPRPGMCATMKVIPVDPTIDPKMATKSQSTARMPVITGIPPCEGPGSGR